MRWWWAAFCLQRHDFFSFLILLLSSSCRVCQGGLELPVYAFNAGAVVGSAVALLWAASLLLRLLSLRRHRHLISANKVLFLDDPAGHPDWLERAYVARLMSRQAREVPAVQIESLSLPFSVQAIATDARDPFAADASAQVLCDGPGEYLWMFGVQRASWTSLKELEHRFPAQFRAADHCVRASADWMPYSWTGDEQKPVTVESEKLERGDHHPAVDDVAVLLLLRRQGSVLAVSAASDGRVLELYLFHARGQVMSVRDTYAEDDDDECLVCCAEPKNTILLPCRHICCCTTCLARMDKCPVCRAPVDSFVTFGEDPAGMHRVAARPEEELQMPDDLQDIELQPM